jgi:hypothetical protein
MRNAKMRHWTAFINLTLIYEVSDVIELCSQQRDLHLHHHFLLISQKSSLAVNNPRSDKHGQVSKINVLRNFHFIQSCIRDTTQDRLKHQPSNDKFSDSCSMELQIGSGDRVGVIFGLNI